MNNVTRLTTRVSPAEAKFDSNVEKLADALTSAIEHARRSKADADRQRVVFLAELLDRELFFLGATQGTTVNMQELAALGYTFS